MSTENDISGRERVTEALLSQEKISNANNKTIDSRLNFAQAAFTDTV